MMWQAGLLHWNVQETATGGGRGRGGWRPWVSCLNLQKKRSDVKLAHSPVLFWMMIFHKMGQ
jgi:hypothetical protein